MREWKALKSHYAKIKNVHLRQLFKNDTERVKRLSLDAVGLYFDYSKNRITNETFAKLIALAEACGLKQAIADMFFRQEN